MPDALPHAPFNAGQHALRKRRAGAGLAAAAFLHQRMAQDMLERLEAINRPFRRALVVGGPADLAPTLRARGFFAVHAEVASSAVSPPGCVIRLDAAPLAEGAFDLVLAPLALSWANDLPGALIQLRRALRPDGLLLAGLYGPETLQELRAALIAAEVEVTGGAALRVAPFTDLRVGAGLLQRAGFALPAADRDRVVVRYATPLRLLQDLRAMGETAALAGPTRPALTRGVLMRALAHYQDHYALPDGRIPATFELITLTGWAPDENQQKPLRPGSAAARLADALGVAELPAGEKAGVAPSVKP